MPEARNGRLATIENKLENMKHWMENDLPLHIRSIVNEELVGRTKCNGSLWPQVFQTWGPVFFAALASIMAAVAARYAGAGGG